VARALGTNHHEVPVLDRDFLEEIPRILNAMDQPTADGVNTYFVSRAAKQLGLTVVLSGLGGDEVFFGYPHYRRLASANGSLRRLAGMPGVLREFVARGAETYGRLSGQERWERFAFLGEQALHDGLYLLMRGFFAPRQTAELLGTSVAGVHAALERIFAELKTPEVREESNRFNYVEMKRYLHDQLLRDSDVFSMAHSIELRVPYLDHRVVELGAAIAPGEKISTEMNKPKLVEAVGHAEVERVARAPKRGFTFPFSKWMLMHADTLEARALEAAVLDRAAVRKNWKEFRAGRLHWSRAWATVALPAATKPS
jgi:asparagine synthase (glutamine-hydrolysing)